MELKHQIYNYKGFVVLKLNEGDLGALRTLIEEHWLSILQKAAPNLVSTFRENGITNYHLNSKNLDHANLWPKTNRILPAESVTKIKKLDFFKKLTSEFGHIELSDEDEVGWEEVYWRLVRPQEPSDVGPMHADRWFWDLGHGKTPPGCDRVKMWIPIYCEPGLNGLKLVPESHKKDWKYHGEFRGGIMKPVFDEKEEDIKVELMHTQPGDAIVFHDRLLHGGAVNKGQQTRVSLEFTMFVKK